MKLKLDDELLAVHAVQKIHHWKRLSISREPFSFCLILKFSHIFWCRDMNSSKLLNYVCSAGLSIDPDAYSWYSFIIFIKFTIYQLELHIAHICFLVSFLVLFNDRLWAPYHVLRINKGGIKDGANQPLLVRATHFTSTWCREGNLNAEASR